MKYQIDNDLHIHSKLSYCSLNEKQSKENILKYAKENGLKTICVADHFWDEKVDGAFKDYKFQNFPHISKIKPLPQAEGIRFLFGCETELDKNLTLGLSKERYDEFDFIVIPTTHFHMKDYTVSSEEYDDLSARINAWIKRIDAVLSMDLPFHKVGLAHLVCPLINRDRKEYLKTLKNIPEKEMVRLFTKAAKLGVGIELNQDMNFKDEEEEIILRPFKIAKKCGCKFYLGSDAHHPEGFDGVIEIFEKITERLGLSEEDKFII